MTEFSWRKDVLDCEKLRIMSENERWIKIESSADAKKIIEEKKK